MMNSAVQPLQTIAFYLPQYHPIPENDEWWGKGFTEWTNVTRARPIFPGHYQPHLPSDLGFYDLRLAETRAAQAALAKKYGISGFCYYHYWFNGRRILERPINEVLIRREPNFPFCLCWANENWTRRWDGQESEVLLKQIYSTEDDLIHIQALLPYLHDSRYIRVDKKPLLLIYRLSALPLPMKTLEIWRKEAERSGLPGIFICNVESFHSEHGLAKKCDLDAAVEFAPDWTCLPKRIRIETPSPIRRFAQRLTGAQSKSNRHNIYSYEELAQNMILKEAIDYPRIPCVTPMWDNSARRKEGATLFLDSTPALYESWLKNRIAYVNSHPECKSLLFINAWNEWAEGNHLEPCQRWGHEYLRSTHRAISQQTLIQI